MQTHLDVLLRWEPRHLDFSKHFYLMECFFTLAMITINNLIKSLTATLNCNTLYYEILILELLYMWLLIFYMRSTIIIAFVFMAYY